jgi:hypothetical protein
MGIGPVPATKAALAKAELTLDDVDVIELNEAFAAQTIACLREWGLDSADERLNVRGSGISLGHPVGATGGRMLAHPCPRAAHEGRPIRTAHHVHRWRPGPRGRVREGHVMARVVSESRPAHTSAHPVDVHTRRRGSQTTTERDQQ